MSAAEVYFEQTHPEVGDALGQAFKETLPVCLN